MNSFVYIYFLCCLCVPSVVSWPRPGDTTEDEASSGPRAAAAADNVTRIDTQGIDPSLLLKLFSKPPPPPPPPRPRGVPLSMPPPPDPDQKNLDDKFATRDLLLDRYHNSVTEEPKNPRALAADADTTNHIEDRQGPTRAARPLDRAPLPKGDPDPDQVKVALSLSEESPPPPPRIANDFKVSIVDYIPNLMNATSPSKPNFAPTSKTLLPNAASSSVTKSLLVLSLCMYLLFIH